MAGGDYRPCHHSPFGGKKIPELMKGLGKGVKSFKDGMNEVESQISDIDKDLNSTAKTPDKIEKIEKNNGGWRS